MKRIKRTILTWSFRKPVARATVEPRSSVFILRDQVGLLAVTENMLLDNEPDKVRFKQPPIYLCFNQTFYLKMRDTGSIENLKSRFGNTPTPTTATTPLCISLAT